MADAAPSSTIRPVAAPHWAAYAWVGAWLAAVAIVAWDAAQNFHHYQRASAMYGVAVNPPDIAARSPTGFAGGLRSMVYPANWLDAQHWITHTQRMLATDEARLRHVDDDNAPDGRAVHWGSPFRWWLGACALIDHAITGASIGEAAERAALFANPALLCLLLAILVPWVARRFGGFAAAFLALAMVGSPPFYVLFAPHNMDHHGLVQACAMVALLALLSGGSGWTRRETPEVPDAWSWLPTTQPARRAFAWSGIAGGAGMWISTAGMIPVFAGIAVGALWSAWFGRRAPEFVRFHPELWRRWGGFGGATAFACYLFEYFPGNLGWRLEVNHPLYALAWVGAGEILAQATAFIGPAAPGKSSRAARLRLGVALVFTTLPVVLIATLGERVFVVSDSFLWSLANDYTPEGQSLLVAIERAGFTASTLAACLPMALVVLVGAWFAHRRTPALACAVTAVPFAAAALFWLMAMKELRWWTVGYGFAFGAVIVVARLAAGTEMKRWQRATAWIAVIALFGPGLVASLQTIARNDALTRDDFFSLAERDLAHTLRQRVGDGPLVVLSTPATTSRLIYFASAQGLGTAYWENLDGMKRAAAIFAARTSAEAHALVQRAGITHLVLLSWDNFAEPYVRLARGLPPEAPITEPAFGLELLSARMPPPWLRQLPDHLPEIPPFKTERALIFEITDRTAPHHQLVRAARHFLHHGELDEARRLIPPLERFSDQPGSQIALARIHHRLGNTAEFARALDAVRRLSAKFDELEPEDRVNLIAVLIHGNRIDEAAAHLRDGLRTFDESTLRRLTPESLEALLALSPQLDIAWPKPELQRLAARLLPADGRL